MGSARAWSPAMALLALFTEKQTSGDGRIYYSRPVTYRQIASWFRTVHGRAPSERTLHRWMAELKRSRSIAVKLEPMRQGMKIFVLSPSKSFRPASRQMSLFSEPVEIPVQKPVNKLRNSQGAVRPKVASPQGQKWPQKRSKPKEENLTTGGLAPAALARPVQNSPGDLEEFYRLRKVLEQMPTGHPRYRELVAMWQKLADRIDGQLAQRTRQSRREAG